MGQGGQADSNRYLIQVEFIDAPTKFNSKRIKLPEAPVSSIKLQTEILKIKNQLYAAGYIEAEFELVDSSKSKVLYHINLGKPYEWKGLSPGNVDEGVLSKIGFRDRLYNQQPMSFIEIRSLFKDVIEYYENNGHPFATIRLDSVEIKENQVSAQLYLQKNKQITIDTVNILGSATLSKQYLMNYLGIKQGDLYNEEKMAAIGTRIKELPYVTPIRSAQVEFFADRTSLTLYLNHKKANVFDGIIGFLPDETTGEVLITGDVKIHLKNVLGKGEEIELNWKRLQSQTQNLNARLRYPFLFNTPFGTEGSIEIYRRDTTFTNITTNVGVQYIFRGGNFIEVFWENDQSNLISTYNLDIVTTLPEYADVQNNAFGVGANVSELDYRINPRSGFDFDLKAGFGNREIKINPSINPVVYDSINLKTNSYKASGKARVFFPFLKRHTVLLGFKGGLIANEELFTNEIYRIGGLHTLRGFDEESIFASSYAIWTLEYRFLLEQNSYLHVFYDQAWYENQVGNQLVTDTPFGFGAGISFETKIGIFSLSYALGKQFSNPILFRASKVHFGFVNYF